jgi:membrane protein
MRTAGLVREIIHGALHHRLNGEAAKTAYYLFLSLFPLLLVVFALTGLAGGHRVFALIATRLEQAAPRDAALFLERLVRGVTDSRRPDILSLGIVLALWTGSNIFVALIQGLNRICEIQEHRRWWRRRLVAIGALVASLALLMASALLLLAGGRLGAAIGLGPSLTVVRYPLTFVLLALLLAFLYSVLPDRPRRPELGSLAAGALVGAAVWYLATAGFRFYIEHVKDYDHAYGFVGAVIVLLLWLYLAAYAALIGCEVVAALEARRR